MSHLTFRGLLTAGIFAAGLAALPTAATAATPASTSACTPLPTTQAFAKIDGDQADYSLAPGGDFEAGSSAWSLKGGARIINGNETLGVTAGKRSLVLPVASTAVSPKFCIDETNPHFRFAYRVDSIGMTGFVASVTYETASGARSTEFFSSQRASITPSKWQSSPKSPLATLIPLQGKAATVQIRITGITVVGANFATQVMGGGFAAIASPLANLGVSIDSVMVDPYRRS